MNALSINRYPSFAFLVMSFAITSAPHFNAPFGTVGKTVFNSLL